MAVCYRKLFHAYVCTYTYIAQVDITDGTKLPLQLVAYMKCEPTVTNFRMDYTYQPSVFQLKPTLTKVTFSVPMDGGVKNALTKPTGKWSAETNRMTWAIGDIPPSDNPGVCVCVFGCVRMWYVCKYFWPCGNFSL